MNLIELMRKPQRSVYTGEGSVRHLDGSALKRPFDPPKPILAACAIGAVVAAILGGLAASQAIDQVLNGSQRAAASVEDNLARDVSYDVPALSGFIALDDDAIRSALTDAGFTTYEFTEEGGSLDIMKLPSDTTVADAAIAYAAGSMDAVTASKYLVGSWRLTCERAEGTDLSVKYADFESADAQAAIQAALESQGWTAPEDVELQTDSVGNTYIEGTVETDAGTCSWRVASCALSAVYDISGLPETAQYVGIRLETAA